MARNYAINQEILYDKQPLILTIHRRDTDGQIIIYPEVARFETLLLQSVSEPDATLTQVILTDQPSIYTFRKDHKIFNYACTMYDTTRSHLPGSKGGQDAGYAAWHDFYNRYASISECAENSWIVRLTYAGTVVYGALIEIAVNTSSQDPTTYTTTFSVYVITELGA